MARGGGRTGGAVRNGGGTGWCGAVKGSGEKGMGRYGGVRHGTARYRRCGPVLVWYTAYGAVRGGSVTFPPWRQISGKAENPLNPAVEAGWF